VGGVCRTKALKPRFKCLAFGFGSFNAAKAEQSTVVVTESQQSKLAFIHAAICPFRKIERT
jgi:hypothetical protein